MKKRVKFLKPKDFNLGENWSDIFVEVKSIRRGDVFYECFRGRNTRLTALTSARRISDGYYAIVKDDNENIGEIFYSEYTDYPAPSLFFEPQYLTEMNKELVYLID